MPDNLAKEELGPLVLWIVEELLGWVPFDNFTAVHENDLVGDRTREAHLVGNKIIFMGCHRFSLRRERIVESRH